MGQSSFVGVQDLTLTLDLKAPFPVNTKPAPITEGLFLVQQGMMWTPSS
ncbi:hypothetical protein [Effusibacillus consociatus]|uniref:Uncharacterized protein n=1 Tax=Effusibacillus consociatus TaxID=1117041 RepID=A0ABV9PV02_9BACL